MDFIDFYHPRSRWRALKKFFFWGGCFNTFKVQLSWRLTYNFLRSSILQKNFQEFSKSLACQTDFLILKNFGVRQHLETQRVFFWCFDVLVFFYESIALTVLCHKHRLKNKLEWNSLRLICFVFRRHTISCFLGLLFWSIRCTCIFQLNRFCMIWWTLFLRRSMAA